MRSEKRNKKKILLLCPHPEGYVPGQRLKYEQYLDIFRQNGYTVDVSPFMSEAFQKIVYTRGNYAKKVFWTLAGYFRRMGELFKIRQYDIVYVFLWVTPFGPPFFEKLVRRLGKSVIYDIDDMIYLQDHKSKANPVISKLKGKTKPIYLFKSADAVITSTDAIQDFASKLNNNVVHIPVTIDTARYRPKDSYVVRDRPIVLGWSGSMSTSPYLHLLDDVLKELRKEINFTLLVMGDEHFAIEGITVEALPWKEVYEVEVIRRFDIGLYPLPANDWVLGKGGGKALQYMAAGVPTVATDVGINYKIISHNENGFLVKTKEEWADALRKLIHHEALRKSVGIKAVKTIEEMYSVNTNKEKYLQILDRF